MAEDCIFNAQLLNNYCEIKLLDRFNPISGVVYGPSEFADRWIQHFSETDKRILPDLIIHIRSKFENILRRSNERSKKDIYDIDSTNNILHYSKKYDDVMSSKWVTSSIKVMSVNNDDYTITIADTAISKCVDIIEQHRGVG